MKYGALAATLLLALSGCTKSRPVPAAIPPPARPAPPIPSAPPPPQIPPARPPPLTPQMSTEQERQLLESTQQTIGATDRVLRQLERRLTRSQERETFLTAQSFLDQARQALATREYQRAANLASKARVLTDDLAARLR